MHVVTLAMPLDEQSRERIHSLVVAASQADGSPPLSDAAMLSEDPAAGHFAVLAEDAGREFLGYAVVLPGTGTVEIVVDPVARGRGIGALLMSAALAHGGKEFWTRGDRSAPHVLAARAGMSPARHLWFMSAPLPPTSAAQWDSQSAAEVIEHGDGDAPYIITTYRGPEDDAGLLAVNAAAFEALADQGSWTQSDLDARFASSWFDPTDLLVMRDAEGVIVGFHWTKVHQLGGLGFPTPRSAGQSPLGEVYVLALDPRVQGGGLARPLLRAGLAHLAERGCQEVILYVDDSNVAARRLYLREGFRDDRLDILYRVVAGNRRA